MQIAGSFNNIYLYNSQSLRNGMFLLDIEYKE